MGVRSNPHAAQRPALKADALARPALGDVMSNYDAIIKQVRSWYIDLPISVSDDIEEIIEALLDLETEIDNQHTEIVDLRAKDSANE